MPLWYLLLQGAFRDYGVIPCHVMNYSGYRMKKKKKGIKIPTPVELPSGNWNVRIFIGKDSSGKGIYKSITKPTQNECIKAAMQYKADHLDEKEKARELSGTVGAAVDKYISSKSSVLSPSTIVGYKRIRVNYFLDLAEENLVDVDTDILQRAVNAEAALHSPKTVKNAFGLFSSALRQYAPGIDLSRVTLPKNPHIEIEIPSDPEVAAMLAAADRAQNGLFLPLCFAVYCGMRRSEIAALTWEDVNLDSDTISINKAIVKGTASFVTKGTKTAAGSRVIPIVPPLHDVLAAIENRPGSVCSLNPDQIEKRYITLRDRLGFTYNFHSLRHYFVSVLLKLGIPKNYIADYVGHETENMIDRVYGHIMADKKTESDSIIGGYFEKLSALYETKK